MKHWCCVYVCVCNCGRMLMHYRSVEPLFESSRFDDALKQLIRNTFPEFYPQGLLCSISIVRVL